MSEGCCSSITTTTTYCHLLLLLFLQSSILISGWAKTDKDILLELKLFLQKNNQVNQGQYAYWNDSGSSSNHCSWQGITCNPSSQVTGIYLNDSTIAGNIFPGFSQLTQLTHLDLSNNTIQGLIPPDLNQCVTLTYLNLSHNLISGTVNLTVLTRLQTLDLTLNRFAGEIIQHNFPALCTSLVTLNISMNNFTGNITGFSDNCPNLKYVDLSSNNFTGEVWQGLERLQEFSIAQNNLTGSVPEEIFTSNSCSLRVLDLSANAFRGSFPSSIANCSSLNTLNLWGNEFTGRIPSSIGLLSNLSSLLLGNNSFDRDIPNQLLNCSKLVFLDLSRNSFYGDIQPVFAKFTSLKYLLLHWNSYTGGLESSGILDLPNLERLDLSYNNLSGPLPLKISKMPKLKFLMLAENSFSGSIPSEYGNIGTLQALDLSFNNLSGQIPKSIGNLGSLLWLMLANNHFTGEIPTEIGNCRSLLWLNVANNALSGKIPANISRIGSDPEPTFAINRKENLDVPAGSGECFAMKRWIPANYPPFSFAYTVMTTRNCRVTWDHLTKGYGIFPMCLNSSSSIRTLRISGYLQLSNNHFSGEIPSEIGNMTSLSLIHLHQNELTGRFPPQIANVPLVMLNVSNNRFFGEFPAEIGGIKCLDSLDLSFNNFSGDLPASMNSLSDLTQFNASYNPLLSGDVPITGQMATFGTDSFVGDPLIRFLAGNRAASPPEAAVSGRRRSIGRVVAFWIFLALTVAFFISGASSLVHCLWSRVPIDPDPELDGVSFDGVKWRSDLGKSTPSTSSDVIKVIRLNKTGFTYLDIVKATRNFSEDMIIGRGGYGVVYKGQLSDGRHVAIKKLERMGCDGEREFRAEMEVLASQFGCGWPHPNLVVLHGWCLFGSEKILVYDYMEGGSLDEVITDWRRFSWEKRLDVALGVARALVFLHHECNPAVVHRDVKASNVLLDKLGNCKVTDFGLARMVEPGETHVSTMVAGTVGYVAPEYGHSCKATTKGDVYSFGVLMMELVTGKRAIDGEEECLVEWVRRIGVRGVIESIMIEGRKRVIEMWGLMKLAMWCTTEAPHVRPDMREVLAMLLSISPDRSSYGGSSDESFFSSL